MISDRRRLDGEPSRALPERVGVAARAGVHLIQIREPDLDARALSALVAACVAAVRGTPARVLVNDRVDVALAAGAHGVHLRGTSMAATRVRAMAPALTVIGRSVHSAEEAAAAAAAGGLDYLIFGTVFSSTSKPGKAPAGLDMLSSVARATPLPVLAVGGVTSERAPLVAAAGAAGVAAIGLFADPPLAQLSTSLQEAVIAFDGIGASERHIR